MAASQPNQEPHSAEEEQIQLHSLAVKPSTSAGTSSQPSQLDTDDITTVYMASSAQQTDDDPSQIVADTGSHTSAKSAGFTVTTQPLDGSSSCELCLPAAAYPRAAEEGCVCVCATVCPTPEECTAAPSTLGGALLQVESEQAGPSGLSTTAAVTVRPPRPPVRAERTPRSNIAISTATQACHAHSLPDMRRPRAVEAQETCGPLTVTVQQLSPAAAVSSDPTTGQAPAPRPSAGSAIRVALHSVASHTSFASPLSSIGPFCRICHEGESREQLISPCRCAGSVGLVHVSCIEKWLSAANKDSCEICMYKYVTERRPKPLLEWLLNPSSPEDSRNLVGDIVCFFLLTALAVIAAYLCLMGASHYLSYKTQWEATGLVVLGLLISSIYCVWLVVTCRYHCRVWQDWRRTHQDVHLLEMKRISHSAVDINNNNNINNNSGGGAMCRACRGGSYACSHCCSVCPVHGPQVEIALASAAATSSTSASAAQAAVATAAAFPSAVPGVSTPAAAAAAAIAGDDDVFTDGAAVGGACGGSICGATSPTVESQCSGGAEK